MDTTNRRTRVTNKPPEPGKKLIYRNLKGRENSPSFLIGNSLSDSKFFGDVSCEAELQSIVPREKGTSHWELAAKVLQFLQVQYNVEDVNQLESSDNIH